MSTLAVPAGPGGGLPVAVGDQNGPQRVGDIRVDARPQGVAPQQAGSPGSGLMALVAVIGLAIVGFTGWKVLGPQDAGPMGPPSTEAVSVDEPALERPPVPQSSSAEAETPATPALAPSVSGTVPEGPGTTSPRAESGPPGGTGGSAPVVVEPEKPALGSASSGPPPVVDRPGAAAADGASAPEAQAPAVPAVQTTPEAPKERAAALGMGLLTISAIPRAQVIVDGRYVRYSPLFRHEVGAGERVVTLITDDGRRTTFSLDVPDGGEARRVYSFKDGAFVSQ